MDGATAALEGGFTDPAQDAARAFRAALSAMARPGRCVSLAGARPPEGLAPAAGALLLVLADADTPVWLPTRLRNSAAAEWLRFHTNAPAAEADRAAFACGRWAELAPLARWPSGTPAYPDRSATLLIEVPALTGGSGLGLRGPGIQGRAEIAPALPEGAAAALAENARQAPLGVDVFLVAGASAMALPRSTRLEA